MARIKPLTFGTAPNSLLNNKEITLKAKGLYTFMNCKPENWEFSYNGLQSQLQEQKTAIKTAIKELEKYGYLIRRKYKKDNGQWGWEYELTLADYPSIENPSMVYPSMENIVDISKKELSKKELEKKKENTITSDEVNQIIEYFNSIFQTKYRTTADRNKKIRLRLKSYSLDEIQKSIDNLKQSSFHNGNNDRGWKAGIDFIIRNDEQIDKFLNSQTTNINYVQI